MFRVAVFDGTQSFICYCDERRYARGLEVHVVLGELAHTAPWKGSRHGPPTPSRAVARILLERSTRRESGLAPGPGGSGWRLLGGPGTTVHFGLFGEGSDAERAKATFRAAGVPAQLWHMEGAPRRSWRLTVPGSYRQTAQPIILECNGHYDGYETLTDFGGPIVVGPS